MTLPLLLVIFISNTIYGIASPFLPKEFEAKNISSTMTGVIFSSYAVASVFVSLIVGKYIDSIGHGLAIFLGSLLMSACIICFGFIDRIDDTLHVILISVAIRLGQGSAAGTINTAAYSYVS